MTDIAGPNFEHLKEARQIMSEAKMMRDEIERLREINEDQARKLADSYEQNAELVAALREMAAWHQGSVLANKADRVLAKVKEGK